MKSAPPSIYRTPNDFKELNLNGYMRYANEALNLPSNRNFILRTTFIMHKINYTEGTELSDEVKQMVSHKPASVS